MPKSSWQRADPGRPGGSSAQAAPPIACLIGSVPLVIEDCHASVLEPVQWTLLEQWTARAISEVGDFADDKDIADFLGLQPLFVQPALRTLREHQLISDAQGGIHPTTALAKAMKDGSRHRKAAEKRFRCLFEPVSGIRQVLHEGGEGQLIVDKGTAQATPATPSDLKKWATSAGGPLGALEVAKVEVQKTRKARLPVEVRIFIDDDDSHWGWDVYEKGTDNRRQELRKACEAEGIHALCRQVIEEHVAPDPEEPAPPAAEEMYVPLHRLKSRAMDILYLEAKAAQNRVLDLIKQSKEEIVMFFPWIKSAGLRHMETHLQAALDRGVAILIGYGIARRPEDEESHADVVAKLGSMRSKNGHAVVAVRWLGSSHTKEMVIDRKHYLHGSHNMLSFVGEAAGQGNAVRRELMSFDSNRERFWPALRNLRSYFLGKQEKFRTDAPKPSMFFDWLIRWQAMLHLGLGPQSVDAALAECPEGNQATLTASRLVLLGLEFQEAETADACLCHLVSWLLERTATANGQDWRLEVQRMTGTLTCLHQAHRKALLGKLEKAGW